MKNVAWRVHRLNAEEVTAVVVVVESEKGNKDFADSMKKPETV